MKGLITDLAHKRRQACKPWLIAILCGALSPLTTLVFAIRQRSWAICFIPIITIFTLNILIYPPGFSQGNIIRLVVQGICGLAVYFISYRQKYEVNDETKLYAKNFTSKFSTYHHPNALVNALPVTGIFIIGPFVKTKLLSYDINNYWISWFICYSIFATVLYWTDYYFIFSIKKILYNNKLNLNIAIPVKNTIKNIKESKTEQDIYQNEKLKGRLEELKELYERGLISQEEYKSLKAKALGL
tara:strand:- start:129 stop:857 length:729 start_codon:yes stop_codon:yes gene_type:complete